MKKAIREEYADKGVEAFYKTHANVYENPHFPYIKSLLEKNKMIEDERQRSDELLLNILPAAIATELKSHGKAKAQRYEKASVLFTDFINFTYILCEVIVTKQNIINPGA